MKIVYAPDGTPGVLAANARDAYEGLGFLHAKHRPLQSLLLVAAAQGRLSELVLPRRDLIAIDTLVHRLDLVRIGQREAPLITGDVRGFVLAYLEGFRRGLTQVPLVFARRPEHTPETLVSALLLSAFLGLAEGQERMERAILDSLEAGADPFVLQQMFAPHLDGMTPRPRALGFGLDVGALTTSGGSNAWAVHRDGRSILCGDPHLSVSQLPALFFEAALRVGDDYWLGATIPGLPGIAVGRNKHVAWSGTFGVADNVDLSVEEVSGTERTVELRRRWQRSLRLSFFDTPNGTRDRGVTKRWWGVKEPASSLMAYMQLPLARSAAEASQTLSRALTLSLHFVIADRSEVRYRHCGHIPRGRTTGALVPGPSGDVYAGDELPAFSAEVVVSANEARTAPDGGVLSTLAQPSYRLDRISELVSGARDVAAMQAIQLDLHSLQAVRLLPVFLRNLPTGELRSVLSTWDFTYTEDSIGASAFDRVYRAAVRSLAPRLGGAWWLRALERTEIATWWCRAIDSLLADGVDFLVELDADPTPLVPWGEAHTFTMPHMVLAGVPGTGRGPFPLPGCIATVRQGNNVPFMNGVQTTGPAYRFVTALDEDAAYTAIAGGIDGSVLSRSYVRWLDDWRAGRFHRLQPPSP